MLRAATHSVIAAGVPGSPKRLEASQVMPAATTSSTPASTTVPRVS